jgi:aminoglycoside N3'-acetyltransferase
VVNPADAIDPSVITQMKLGFSDIGAAFEACFDVMVGQVGDAESRLIDQRPLVDFATTYFNDHPYGDATRDKGVH